METIHNMSICCCPSKISCSARPQLSHLQDQSIIHNKAIAHVQDVTLQSEPVEAPILRLRREGVGSLCRRMTPLQVSELGVQQADSDCREQIKAAYFG